MEFWPSTRVTQGGIFHPRKVVYSKETHDLIKLMMEEQKMSIFQRNKVEYYLRTGTPLPMQLYPQQKPPSSRSASCQVRSRTARRRTLDTIQASGAFDYQKYIPNQLGREPCEKQKVRLQEKMSGLKLYNSLDDCKKLQSKHKLASYEYLDLDPIDELLREISERADWIKEMEELGEDKPYRADIRAEIAQRLNQIKQLEKLRRNN